ncbi:MAG: HAMP domain-containing histidine kinase [Lachnospiraceae bacterium]|nr:HAMP domain-containing histidine kinase [Lachnospiraceae bacterium]
MKLFRAIYMQVFIGMTVLTVGMVFLLLSAMMRQSLSDARQYGEEALRNNTSALRESVQRETAGYAGETVRVAVLISVFSDIFTTQGVLWREGVTVYNDTPYEFDQRALRAMCDGSDPSGIWVSAPQNVGGKKLLIFYQDRVPIWSERYSLAVYQDVTDIVLRIRKMLVWGLGFGTVLLILVGVLIYRKIHSLLMPLEELKGSAASIALGNYDTCVVFSRKNEIGELAECFNQMAARIREHIEVMSEMNRRQKQLLGGLAHEMRTPLAAVIGNTDLLLTLRLKPDERDTALLFISREAKRLANLSEKMLELTGLCERDSSMLERRETGVYIMLDRIKELTTFQMSEHGLHLETCCIPGDLKKEMDMDMTLSLLLNLIDNACKASEEGGRICVSASEKELSVEDYGKGIPAEEIHRVTEAFYMVDRSRSRRAGGVGLGLALCRQIALLHGWELRIESTQGRGTRILIRW